MQKTSLVILLLGFTLLTSPALATDLFWTDTNGVITRLSSDETEATDVLPLSGQGLLLSIDPIQEKMFWTQSGDLLVRRANLDGSEIESVVDFAEFGQFGGSFALDSQRQQLYWRQIVVPEEETVINRINFDNTETTTLLDLDGGGGGAMAVDPIGQRFYWTTAQTGAFGTKNVRSANFDGSDVQVLASGLRYSDIEVDSLHGKVYWTTVDTGDRRIQRANLDGSDLEDVIPDTLDFSEFSDYVHLPRSITLDPVGGRIFWVNNQSSDDRVMSARLDGTDICEVFRSPSSGLNAIAAVPTVLLLGDCNLDGVVNFLDISPFIETLSVGNFQVQADVNEDGMVNFLDISSFVGLLSL